MSSGFHNFHILLLDLECCMCIPTSSEFQIKDGATSFICEDVVRKR